MSASLSNEGEAACKISLCEASSISPPLDFIDSVYIKRHVDVVTSPPSRPHRLNVGSSHTLG